MRALVSGVLILLWWGGALAQTPQPTPITEVSARFISSTLAPLTGESFTLTLMIDIPPDLILIDLPTFAEIWGDFEVVQVGDLIEMVRPDSSRTYTQTLIVRLWRPRDYVTPETIIGYGFNRDDTNVFRVPARAEFITVPTVLDFDDQTLRPFRPLIDLFFVPWWVIVGGGVLVVASGWFALKKWHDRPRNQYNVSGEVSALERAELALAGLSVDGDGLPVGSALVNASGVVRVYLWERFDIPAPDLTTAELIEHVAGAFPAPHSAMLEKLLTEADLVKFAGKSVSAEACARALTAAIQWVRAVDGLTLEERHTG